MNFKYLVVYFCAGRIQNIYVVPKARNSKEAKRIAANSEEPLKEWGVSAVRLDRMEHLWSWKITGR